MKNIDDDEITAFDTFDNLIKSGKYDIIIPLSDFSANLLAQKKEYYENQYKVKIATNDINTFNKAYDKLQTMKICMDNNIPCPITLPEVFNINDVPLDIAYPLVVKPRSACGSIGFHIVYRRIELQKHLDNAKLGPLLVQEFIPQNGKQYNVHLFFDKNSELKSGVVTEKCRWFPIDGGSSTLCKTINRQDILNECVKLLKILKWVGYCDVDLLEDPRDGMIKIIEINARISANVKICFLSGVDISKQLLELYSGQEVTEFLDYKKNVCLRCIHTDFLWFIKSKNRFKTKPSWFRIYKTYDQIFSLDDPFPFLSYSIQSVFKYKKEMKKRER